MGEDAKSPTPTPVLLFFLLRQPPLLIFIIECVFSKRVHDAYRSTVHTQLRGARCRGQGHSVGLTPVAFALTSAPFCPCSPTACGQWTGRDRQLGPLSSLCQMLMRGTCRGSAKAWVWGGLGWIENEEEDEQHGQNKA